MKFPQQHQLQQIASIIDSNFVGAADYPVLGMNEIHRVEKGDIVFVDHPKYYDAALYSDASVILIDKKVDCPDGKALLISDDPFRDFNKLTEFFKPFEKLDKTISASAEIGEGTQIQPGATIGNHVKIGKNCVIHSNVSIYDRTEIGDNVIVHANAVIGSSAFYYKKRPEGFDQLRSGGNVVLEDFVEIGAACTIDRGVSADTRIKKGSKLDNQVHVGHDTIIGERCLIASQCGIAGCVVLEDEVTLWGQVGIKNDVEIGEKAVIMAQSGVGKSLEGQKAYFGSPAQESRKMYRELVNIRKIPTLIEQLKKYD
jgi:UDP-3-O-[3-hydroxymyristoyl] glucosamine N-acyltransferase